MPESPKPRTFRIAHVTDPHFRAHTTSQFLAGVRVGDLFTKRAVGAANLVLNRRRKHKMELLQDLGRDLSQRSPDHLVVTGDLGNVGLIPEWQAAVAWLDAVGTKPRNVTVIPGNHDVYTDDVVRSGSFETNLASYQKADFRCGSDTYPFVRFRGDFLAFIAVNTAVPTHDLGAWGEIGTAQLRRLETLLTDPEIEKRVRVVLIHHPPVKYERGEEHNLRDRDALCALLAKTGADLVLHGHDHRDEITQLAGPDGKTIPAVGAGSASYAGASDRRSRYNIYELTDDRALTWVTYAHDEATRSFREVRREKL